MITGSVGQGNWATVPWVCIFDRRITTTATKGVYIVYLLEKDGNSLYLTFNQGCTEIRKAHSKRETISIMREKAAEIISKIDARGFCVDEEINLGSGLTELGEFYQKGTIFYKEYKKNAIPNEDELQSDLAKMMDIYREYAHRNSDSEKNREKANDDQDHKGGEVELTVRDTIAQIRAYIEAKGFSYQDGLIENYYLSLKSKPFVILAGTSGTGKTKLVKLFAEAIGATAENGRYKLVPVRPDWSDSTDLFGHTDLNNRFHPGAILDFLKEAEAHPDKPYFLCLDEMNLARVEYYLSDILSVIETREKTENGRIVSVPLMSPENYGGDADAAEIYGTVRFPENLCLIGTVNMDETTFPFSKKVLDRANTIEFSDVDLIPDFETFEVAAEPVNPGTLFLKPDYLQISHCKAQREYIHTVCESLQELNAILMKANAHVGFRVRDEICFYMLNNKNSELLAEEAALDNEIMQKILPRIQGSSNQIRELLCSLFKYCAGDYTGYDSNSDYEAMKTYLQNKGGKYRNSAEKIMSMVRRFDEDGFTSYWI